MSNCNSSEENESQHALHGTDARCTDPLEYDNILPNQAVAGKNSIPDVYEVAAAIGACMEPILDEFGHDKLEPLTKEVVQCLELFEKTVNILTKETEKSLEFQYSLEKSQHECNQLKTSHETEVERLDDTIFQLQTTIDSLQQSNDTLVENWDFESEESRRQAAEELERQPSAAELNIAKQLRETHEKVNHLEREKSDYKDDIQILSDKLEKYQRLEDAQYLNSSKGTTDLNASSCDNNVLDTSAENNGSRNISHASDIEEKEAISITELQKVLRDKNFYKEKCFAMEDQLMEMKMVIANQKLQNDSAAVTLDPNSNKMRTPNRTAGSSFLDMISPSKPNLRRLFSLANRSSETTSNKSAILPEK